MKLMIQTWPDSVHVQNKIGFLPLHYACYHGCTKKILQILVETGPEALKVKTIHGKNLPLHMACKFQSSWMIRYILDCYPDAARIQDAYSRLPLHVICGRNWTPPLEVIGHLLRAWPESVIISGSRIYGEDED